MLFTSLAFSMVAPQDDLSMAELSIKDLTELQTPEFQVKCKASEVLSGYEESDESRVFDEVKIPFNGLMSDVIPLFDTRNYESKNMLTIQFIASQACKFNEHDGIKNTGRCMDVTLATVGHRGSVLKEIKTQVEMYNVNEIKDFKMEIPAFNVRGSDDEDDLKKDFCTVSKEDASKNVYKVKCY